MKDKKFLISIILILLINILAIVSWFYFLSILKNQNQSMQDIKYKIQSAVQKINAVKLSESLLENEAENKTKIDSVFLDDQTVVKLIDEVDSLKVKTGADIKIGAIDFNISNKPHLQLKAGGTFSQIYQSIVLLENMPYMFDFNNVSLNFNSEQKSWSADIDITINNFLNL